MRLDKDEVLKVIKMITWYNLVNLQDVRGQKKCILVTGKIRKQLINSDKKKYGIFYTFFRVRMKTKKSFLTQLKFHNIITVKIISMMEVWILGKRIYLQIKIK